MTAVIQKDYPERIPDAKKIKIDLPDIPLSVPGAIQGAQSFVIIQIDVMVMGNTIDVVYFCFGDAYNTCAARWETSFRRCVLTILTYKDFNLGGNFNGCHSKRLSRTYS